MENQFAKHYQSVTKEFTNELINMISDFTFTRVKVTIHSVNTS